MVTKKISFLHFFIVVSAAVALLDQLLKVLVLHALPEIDLRWLQIHLVTNTGAGFGILQDQTVFLAIISLAVALAIIINYKKIPRESFAQACFALFLGGVIGNLLDRLFRGHVIDFLDPAYWPAFNLADAAISVAVFGLILDVWKRNQQKAGSAPTTTINGGV